MLQVKLSGKNASKFSIFLGKSTPKFPFLSRLSNFGFVTLDAPLIARLCTVTNKYLN